MHFNYDFNLVFYLAGLIYFLYIFISKRKAMQKKVSKFIVRRSVMLAEKKGTWLSK